MIRRAAAEPGFIQKFAQLAGVSEVMAKAIISGRITGTDEQVRILNDLVGIPNREDRDPDPEIWHYPDYEGMSDLIQDE